VSENSIVADLWGFSAGRACSGGRREEPKRRWIRGMKTTPFHLLVAMLAGWLNSEQ
jgi:hypothetical protein